MPTRFGILAFLILLSGNLFAQSTIFFYRLKSLHLPTVTCKVKVNDTLNFVLENGSYKMVTTAAESITMKTSVDNNGIENLKLEKGKTYYVEVQVKSLSVVNFILNTEDIGKPAIERLKADQNANTTNTAELGSLKVTLVEPLPKPKEDAAKIYFYRPLSINGVGVMATVSTGDSLFMLRNKSAHTYTTTADQITLSTVNDRTAFSNSTLNLKLEKGKVYYVAVLLTGGAILLTETKEEYAKKEMKLQ